MKSIFKLMTVALAAGLVVSCSDELNLEQKAALHVEKGDLVGTLYSESPTRVAMLDEIGSEGYPAVWSDEDQVNVFSPIRLNFNQYELTEGAGTNQGKFEPLEEDPTLLEANDLYAVTAAAYQYGVSKISANADDKDVLLTATIPCAFDWEQLAANEDAYNMPSPWWGPAAFGDAGELNVAFRPLTAVMRIDLADLPEGVNSIVLVTGNNTAVGATYSVNGEEYMGTGEGLSGTFNATLSLKNAAETALASDSRLICYDTLRVDLPEATKAKEDKVLFVPIIAQHYDNLKVIAVQEDDVLPYTWTGEILRTYTDLVVENGDLLNLSQTAEQVITLSSPLLISQKIAQMYDGKHSLVVSVPNIDFTNSSDNTLYILNNPKSKVGQTSVTINFPENDTKNADAQINIAEIEGVFTGNVPNTGAQFMRLGDDPVVEEFPEELGMTTTDYTPEVESAAKERTVRLNFAAKYKRAINVTLPTSNVEVTSAQKVDSLNIITANTYNVSGYDYDATYNAVSNEQNAALKFTGVYGVVNYAGTGAVYFLEEDSEITEELNIFGKNPKSLRITDALINTISYPTLGTGTSYLGSSSVVPTAYIFTTGSAAIMWLNEPADKIKIKAFWTSRRLTPHAVESGYEGSKVKDPSYNIADGAIYTAAQLQGMGMAEDKYAYTISPKVESIWLGGVTFPWIGAEIEKLETIYGYSASGSYTDTQEEEESVDSEWSYKKGTGEKIEDAFSLDGRNVTLKNMILDIYDPNVQLPGCCGTTQKIRLIKNLGLIRSIRTKETVDLFNIQLDDVLLDAHQFAIDNIGSLVGIIQAEKDVTIGGKELNATVSNFTDIRIASKGNNIGGIVGELEAGSSDDGAAVTFDNVKVESIEKNNQYIHGGHIQGKNNVGGLAGRVTYDGAYDNSNDSPTLGSVTKDPDVTTYTYWPVEKREIAADSWWVVDSKGKEVEFSQHPSYSPGQGGLFAPAARVRALRNLYYISPTDGSATQENGNAPRDGVTYYSTSACTDAVKVGTFKVYSAAEIQYWYDNGSKKIDNFMSGTAYLPKEGESVTGKTEIVVGEDTDPFEAGKKPYDWENTYYYRTESTKKGKVTVTGSTYPTALTVSNAKVNFDNAGFDGKDQGIIKGENGDNVGGMFGFAVINGPTNMWKNIDVAVPMITATTKETKSTLVENMPVFGNNVGGLIGTYHNVNDSKDPIVQSSFAGKIKARKGIVSESSIAGGVLGLSDTYKITPTTNHSDKAQVLFAQSADLNVEVGELKAVNGWVGGIIGYQEMGKVDVAHGTASVTVKAAKMIGANTIGGLIGEQNDMAWIGANTNSKKVNVTIDAVELTKGISYFSSNAERDYCGTIGTLVGQKNQWLFVNSDNVIAKIEGAALLSNARKDALLFKYNVSGATTEKEQAGYKFWGDEKGYVGFAKETSMYFVKNAQQGNYEFNIYMVY